MNRNGWSACACLAALAASALAGEIAPKKRESLKAREDEAIEQVLKSKKVSFEFVDTPLRDAVAFMRQVLGVNVVVEPGVDVDQKLNLKIQDMAAGTALKWLARAVGAKMDVKDGAVFLAPGKGVPPVHKPAAAAAHKRREPIGRAEVKLGEGITVELDLYEEDLPPETRELLSRLLRMSLARDLEKLEKKGDAGKE